MTHKCPQVTAVVVAYESRDTIDHSLEALRAAYETGVSDTVVVDNASPDGTADCVAERHPWATLVRSDENLGYGRGCNLGWQHATTPYVIFMNADATVTSQAIETMQQFMERRPRVGLVAPAIECGSGEYQEAGGLPTPLNQLWQAAGLRNSRTKNRRLIKPGAQPFETDWLCGAVLFARSRMVRELDGFDPRFFLYFEETDLCLRARQAGYELWAVGGAVVEHISSASARKTDPALAEDGCLSKHYYQSRYYYLAKHHGLCAATLAEVGELMLKGVRDIARIVTWRGRANKCRRRLQSPFLAFPPPPFIRKNNLRQYTQA